VGAGHIEGTALPGERGNSGIAGHRDTFFRELLHFHPLSRQSKRAEPRSHPRSARKEISARLKSPENLSLLIILVCPSAVCSQLLSFDFLLPWFVVLYLRHDAAITPTWTGSNKGWPEIRSNEELWSKLTKTHAWARAPIDGP
jgi:hypothetical protein